MPGRVHATQSRDRGAIPRTATAQPAAISVGRMKVALTVNDFLRRAELLYPGPGGDRRRAGSAGRVVGNDHVRRDGTPGEGDGGRARRARHRRRRAGGDRVAQLGAAADGVVRGVGLGSDPGADQLPARRRGGQVHRRPLRRPVAARRSRARGRAGRRRVRDEVDDRCRQRRHADALRRRAPAVGGRRGRHGDGQLHVGHDRAPQGCAAHAPQHLAQRHHLRLAHGGQRPRRVSAHAAPVPLQRVGDAVRGHRDGRRARDPAQGRRRRDPAPCRPARRDVDVRGAGGAQHDPRRRRHLGRPDPRPRSDADRGRRCATADAHDRALRDRARLGVRPDLRAHRDDAGADDEPHPRRMGRARAPASGR